MDNTTELLQQRGMAKMLFSALHGVEPDADTKALAASYSKKLFITPWRDESDTTTQAYAQRFFDSLSDMGRATRLTNQWQHGFDENDEPLSAEQARAFISDFFRVYHHYPRAYHNFVCQRRDIRRDGVLDFPIEHPISVDFWAIYITVAGENLLEGDGDSTRLGAGSITVVPPGCHCTLSRSNDEEHWVYDWLSFRSKLEWIELLEWASELTRPIFFSTDDADTFKHLLQQTEQLESTTYLPNTLSERLCNNIIENLLIRIRLLAESIRGGEIQTDRRIQGAVDYILNHFGENITLDKVARRVSISPSRLSALFREHFGISLIKWRDQIRMQKAKELIKHSNQPIGDIANRVGYPDPLYFSRRFKDHFGVAPSDFRTS